MKKYIINIYGTSLRVLECSIPNDLYVTFDEFRIKHNLSWEDFFYDFDVLNHFKINHWSDYSNSKEMILYPLTTKNKIEVKERNKFILKMNTEDILNQVSLFELYKSNSHNYHFNNKEGVKNFILIQEETGLSAKFEMETIHFDVNQLEFNYYSDFLSINEKSLFEISYENIRLENIKEDTLIRSLKVKWI